MGAREFVTKRLRAIGKSFEQSQAPPKAEFKICKKTYMSEQLASVSSKATFSLTLPETNLSL